MAESYVNTLRSENANLANSPDSKTVMAELKDCFEEFNSYHQDRFIGYLPPMLFSKKQLVT
jgi:putative transposase